MNPTETIVTSSGIKVYITSHITVGMRRRIQRIFLAKATYNLSANEPDFDASTILDAQEEAVRLLVQKIETTDGAIIQGGDRCLDYILNMTDPQEAQIVFDAMNKITTPTIGSEEYKKKEIQ